jgi:hypothetical protein
MIKDSEDLSRFDGMMDRYIIQPTLNKNLVIGE